MTTDVERVYSPDLYAPNESWTLDVDSVRSLAHAPPPLAAVTYVATKQSPEDNLEVLMDLCRSRVEASLYSDHDRRDVMMFVADGPWQPPSALVKKKKLWGRNPWAMNAAQFPLLGPEIMVEGGAGIRYAGLATVAREGFGLAVQIARKSRACAIFVRNSARMTEAESAMPLFSAAFPRVKGVEAQAINWTTLALFVCAMDGILVRASGSFDDASAAIDLIFNPMVNSAASL